MKFRIITILIASLIFITTTHAEGKKYKIGVILPLSGDAASIGNFSRRSIELAYSELPQASKDKIELFFEDDQLQPAKSVSAFRMLKDTKNIDAALVLTSGVGHAVAPIAEKAGVLMIDVGASDKSFAVGKKYVFIHWVSPEMETSEMVKEIAKRGYKKIAMISHEHQGVTAFNESFMNDMKNAGLSDRIIVNQTYTMDTKDFGSAIARIRKEEADAVYLALFSGGLSSFAKKAKELGVKGDLFGAEFFEDEHEVKASEGALIGSWYVNADDADSNFVKKYREKYNEHPGLASANSYDTMNLISKALESSGHDNLKMAEYFRALKDYKGAAGTYSASGDNRFTLPATVKRVTKDGFERIG